jgi:hypothetical protein
MPTLPEPSWPDLADVQLAGGSVNSPFIGGQMRPSWITGYLQSLLQEHFSLATNIKDEQLRGLLWVAPSDDETNQPRMHIEPSWAYDVTHLQQRPALYVSRGPMQTQRMAIADKHLTALSANGNYEGEQYVRILQGQHQVIVAGAKSRMAVEKLAEEVFYMLLEYSPAISKDTRLSNFIVTGLTEVEKIDEDHENYMVGVQCAWMTSHSWTLKPLAPILKSIGS